ncbi:hypothetical protein EPL68_05210, partial [Clostridioides difficile]|nr:hypothetical protein [Clostridioides difficile]
MIFYDFEVFSYDWLVVFIDVLNKKEEVIVNDIDKLNSFYIEHREDIFIGYNSRHYDQYIFKGLLCGFNAKEINDYIIVKGQPGWKFSNLLRNIQINNYDVMTSFHGLKQLEGFQCHSIKESNVSFNIDRPLTNDEIEETIKYCRYDVEQTIDVFIERKSEFEAYMGLIKAFKLPVAYIGKTQTQLTAIILEATKKEHDDEFDLQIPDTLKIEKYKEVLSWYKNPLNYDYSKNLKINISNVPHVFAWGGVHGAITKYYGEGYFLHVDVNSFYPSLMIRYNYHSRNIKNPQKYVEIYDKNLQLKKEKSPLRPAYKLAVNKTYGGMKDKNNNLYDPRQANNVCVSGQLLLLDLIEKLEGHCKLIQSNTDGLIIKLNTIDDYELIDDICYEWEQRTGMGLGFDVYTKIFQKDVNNYLVITEDGEVEAKGLYIKDLGNLDYDLPIINKALKNYMVNNTPIEETINNCNDLIEFQKIVKISSKYSHGLYSPTIEGKTKKVFTGGKILNDKCFRVFASKNKNDGGIY